MYELILYVGNFNNFIHSILFCSSVHTKTSAYLLHILPVIRGGEWGESKINVHTNV